MLIRQRLTAILLSFFLPLFSIGQTQKPKQQLEDYLLQLKGLQVDTFLVIKSGCAGCEVKYADTSKAVTDGQTIYILSQQVDKFKIVAIDDFGRQETYDIDTTSLFGTIMRFESVLQQKDIYYKKVRSESKKGHFLPPRPKHYSYNDLAIKIAKFTYKFNVIENDSGMFAFPERGEKWYAATNEIIDNFFLLLKSVRP
ncbi:MAG: hypothetical protein LC109_02240 [Bacteroidia bacterium]|nr:hypothetical protein [Bacteroidia bacterium]